MKPTVNEDDVVKFLLECGGEATLEEISSALKIPKYGPNSAYAILYSLKSKNVVERRGSRWALIEHEASQGEFGSTVAGGKSSIEETVGELTKILKEKIVRQKRRIEAIEAKTEVEDRSEVKETYFLKPDRSYENFKSLESLQTGTFLDAVFLGFNGEPLGGIPVSGQFMIIGPLGAGKSLFVSEIALRTSYSGLKVLYIILDDVWKTKAQTFDLQSRMRLRAEALSLNWDYVSDNLYVLNPDELNEDFIEKYRRLIDDENIELIILDSINSFERLGRPEKAGEILDEIIRDNRKRGVTGLFTMHVNLRHEESWMQIEGRDHLLYAVDGVILIAPAHLKVSNLNVDVRGIEQFRVIQVLSCRICCFERRGILANITRDGLLNPLSL